MAEDAPKTSKRLLRVVLVMSLALNLIVVGLVVGAAMSGRLGKGPPRAFDLGVGPVARALAPQERRAIGDALRRDNDLSRAEMRAQLSEMTSALRQEPFDASALRDVLAAQSVRRAELQARAQDALITQIEVMSPERRAEFADQVENALRRPRVPKSDRSGG